MRKDSDRLAKLRQCLVLDTAPEQAFDDLARLLANGLDVPMALVNLLDADRDWFKAAVGLPATESPVASSFCELFFRCDSDVLVVPDTLLDPQFSQHPLVVKPPHVRFYAAARLLVDGLTVGTLCAYDLRPRSVTVEQIEQMRTLAGAAMALLRQRLHGKA